MRTSSGVPGLLTLTDLWAEMVRGLEKGKETAPRACPPRDRGGPMLLSGGQETPRLPSTPCPQEANGATWSYAAGQPTPSLGDAP